jgi:pyrroloquinoline quinone (PQQ) biosynthesis protein C
VSFAEALYAAARPKPLETHPFITQVRNGDANAEEIRSFALHLASATESFVRALHAILSICPDPDVRHALISNVLEEEGTTGYVPGVGATFDATRHHPTMAKRFARAAGATDAAIAAFTVGPPRWFQRALQVGNWLGPFAYIAVGTEANIPPTYRLLVPPFLSRYGFNDSDLEFLYEHMTVDDRHGEEGAGLIAAVATTQAAQQQALEGARRGGNGWWKILEKHVGAAVPA